MLHDKFNILIFSLSNYINLKIYNINDIIKTIKQITLFSFKDVEPKLPINTHKHKKFFLTPFTYLAKTKNINQKNIKFFVNRISTISCPYIFVYIFKNIVSLCSFLKKNYILTIKKPTSLILLIKNILEKGHKCVILKHLFIDDKNKNIFITLKDNYITKNSNILRKIYKNHNFKEIHVNVNIKLYKNIIFKTLLSFINNNIREDLINNIIYVYNIINNIIDKYNFKRFIYNLFGIYKFNLDKTTKFLVYGNKKYQTIEKQNFKYKIHQLTIYKKINKYTLYNIFNKFIYGQNKNIKKIINVLTTTSTCSKPIGSWLLCGSSGTGKTEIAKLLTNYLYKDNNKLIRYDMSEYKESHSVSKLIGSPPGYAGYNSVEGLVEKILKTPESVILFDEIEKANKDIFSIFLQILDEGILTNSKGITGTFNKSIILFTSNLGSEIITETAKTQLINIQYYRQVQNAISKFLKPEFINRLTNILIFSPLRSLYLYQLTEKQTGSSNLPVELSANIKAFLSLFSYSPMRGSRFILNNLDRFYQNFDNEYRTNIGYENKKFFYSLN